MEEMLSSMWIMFDVTIIIIIIYNNNNNNNDIWLSDSLDPKKIVELTNEPPAKRRFAWCSYT